MWHTLGIIVGFIMIIGGLGAFGIWAWHSTLPKRETLPKHRFPTDLKVPTDGIYEFKTEVFGAYTDHPVSKHYVDHTKEFSAIPAGENKHYSDETREMKIVSLPPVPRG